MKYLLFSFLLVNNLVYAACETSQYQEFDFWLGQWQVSSPSSKQSSHNTITKINNGCGLLEEYTTKTGFEGKSLNIFDAQTQQWHQTWIDNTGYLLRLSGGMEGSSMVMTGETRGKKDKLILNRITWTPKKNGDVRQHWQTSNDNGKTWQTAFDGLYHKVSH
jgi:hypothetical protein